MDAIQENLSLDIHPSTHLSFNLVNMNIGAGAMYHQIESFHVSPKVSHTSSDQSLLQEA